jgi:hypothetical protein
VIPDIKNLLIALAIGLAVGLLGGWHFTAKYKDATWTASIDKQKSEAATKLQEATERALATERKNTELGNQLEKQHVESTQNLDRVLADNRRLTRELGGLRDPGRRQSCGGSVPAPGDPTGQPAPSATGGELSAEASEFLLEFARDADRAAQYAKTCYDWTQQLNRN